MSFDVDAVVLDLDGTLVDSVPDLALAIGVAMRDLSLPVPSQEAVRQWVGNGAPVLLKRALTGKMDGEPEASLFHRAVFSFRRHYAANVCVSSRLYPGVGEGLATLRAGGMPLGCVTNKPHEFTVALLEKIGLEDFFRVVVGGDRVARMKPAPDALLLAADALGVVPERMLMIGDSVNDVEAARNAGCPVICVPYGYNHGHNIAEARPDAIVQSLADVSALLNRPNREA